MRNWIKTKKNQKTKNLLIQTFMFIHLLYLHFYFILLFNYVYLILSIQDSKRLEYVGVNPSYDR